MRRRIIGVAEMFRRRRGIVLLVTQILLPLMIVLLVILLAHLATPDHTGCCAP